MKTEKQKTRKTEKNKDRKTDKQTDRKKYREAENLQPQLIIKTALMSKKLRAVKFHYLTISLSASRISNVISPPMILRANGNILLFTLLPSFNSTLKKKYFQILCFTTKYDNCWVKGPRFFLGN